MTVSEAVSRRRSVRAFLDTPVDIDAVHAILVKAARAASGGNLQPWHVDLVHGEAMVRLKAIMAEKTAAREREEPEYAVYPRGLAEPWEERRNSVGEAMYGALAIPREDRRARAIWFSRNFQFFDAPVGLFISLDRTMGPPQWADAGALLATIMLLLVEAGLDSCPQECWAIYPRTLGGFLSLPDSRILWTGLSIGVRDPEHPVNCSWETERAPPSEWLAVHG